MNNPYPSALQLRAEARVDRILAEQESAAGQFRSAATALLALFRELYFPVTSPVQGWALDEIEAALSAWAHDVRDPDAVEEMATDMVEEYLANEQPRG